MRKFFSSLVVITALASSASAASPKVEASLATPVAAPQTMVLDGRIWSCTDVACTATGAGTGQTAARECARAKRKLGAFTAYVRDGVALDAAALTACNAA